MEEKRITEKESLEIITSMIAKTKERYMLGDGNIMLMWGYVTVAVSLIVWITLATTHNPAANWLWFLIWVIGGSATPVMARKGTISKGVKTYTDTIVSRLWSVVGASAVLCTLFCLGFMIFRGIDTWALEFAFALIIVPFAEISQGIILNEKSLIWGGGVGLVAGVFITCCMAGHILLHANLIIPVVIVAFTFMMIIPGHIINYKAHKQ